MAGENTSFNDFIQAARDKKKKEKLANEILGRGRKNTPGAGVVANNRKGTPQGPSLASRMGVNKQRSSSAKPNINGKWAHDLHQATNPRGPRNQLQRTASASFAERNNRIYNELRSQDEYTDNSSSGFSIKGRGSGGPFTVVAQNFAHGTTAADIDAVMNPIGGQLSRCQVVASNPTVIVEMDFDEREGAEKVIATFNNKKADGQHLYVYMKETTGASRPARVTFTKAAHGRPAALPRRSSFDDGMEMDDGEQIAGRVESRRAEPSIQDGRYGFSEKGDHNRWREPRRARDEQRLYSDSIRRERY